MIERMTEESSAALRSLARQHLPADVADRWLALLRPGVRLTAASGSDAPVGRLGGLPELPDDTEWPTWEGHGPLAFIASLDCAALPPGALDIALPAEGTLAFFYFDGQLDDGKAVVLAEDPGSQAGARVLHFPAGGSGTEQAAPAGLESYPVVPLAARVQTTAAEPWHPRVREAFAPEDTPPGRRFEHPVSTQEFLDALWERDDEPGHRIGGYACSIQNPVEIEVAHAALGGHVHWDDPELAEESLGWTLLAQFDSDDSADMMWGDGGALYWLIRPRDLAEGRFDRAVFTWQCS
jgi:uncharacterized protein YwqG